METDLDLFIRFQKGDKKAFRHLYQKYRQPIFGYACQITGSTELGEEVYAETWMAILKNTQSFDGKNIRALLYKIAHNKALNLVKMISVESQALSQVSYQGSLAQASPERNYEEQVELMDQISQSLKGSARETYELRKAGLSYEEIARKTNTPVGTVKSRMFNIIKKLRKQVERHDLP